MSKSNYNIIINIKQLHKITKNKEIMLMFLKLALDSCNKNKLLIEKSVLSTDKNMLHNATHNLCGISSIGVINIPNIAEKLKILSKNEIFCIEKVNKYLLKLDNEIHKFEEWIKNFENT